MAFLLWTEPYAVRAPGSPEDQCASSRPSNYSAHPPGRSFTALGSLRSPVGPQHRHKSPSQLPPVPVQALAIMPSSTPYCSFSPAPFSQPSSFHNPCLSSFPMNSTSPEFAIDPSHLSQTHKPSSTSAPDISKSPNVGLSSHTSQDVFLTAGQTLQLLEQTDVRRPSSGGSIHSEFSNYSGQANGSPHFDNLCLDYGLHHTSDAASIGSSSNLSFQYDQPEQPTHSSPASFSIGHSRNSSISSIPPDSIQPAFSLPGLYPAPGVLEPFSAPDQSFDRARFQSGHQGAFQFALQDSPTKERNTKRDSTGAFLSGIPQLNYTDPTGPQNAYSSKPPTLNIATDLSVNAPVYLHPNDALQRPGQARRSPARQRSRSEGDLLSRLLFEAQAGTNAERQMLKDDAGVQQMAAIALSPKTPVQFHAENHFQFPPAHLAISQPPSLESITSNFFLAPSTSPGQDSLGIPPSQSRRRRAVSACLGLTPIQDTFNNMLPFEHPLLTDQPSSSTLAPQIVLSSEFTGQRSPGRIPDLTPEFVLPMGGGKMDLDEPSESGYNSQFLPFQSSLTGFKTSSATSSPNLSQASYATTSSESVSFGRLGTYQMSSAAGRSNENQMYRTNPFDSRPSVFSFPFRSTSSHQPVIDLFSPPLQTYPTFNDPVSQQQHTPLHQHTRQHHQPQTGWSDGTQPMTGIFGLGLEPEPGGGEASGSNARQAAPLEPKERNVGGRIRRIAPGTRLCTECGATFTRKDRLKYHIESKHLKLSPHFLCEIPGCIKAFRQRSDLVRHIKHVHRDLQEKNKGSTDGGDLEIRNTRRKSKS